MRKTIIFLLIAFWSLNALGQVMFTLGNSVDKATWYKLGTLTLDQQGRDATIRICGGSCYNAGIDQNAETIIHFRTSNGTSNNNGFYGAASFCNTGRGTIIKALRIVQINLFTWEFYANLGMYTGDGAILLCESAQGSWTKDFQIVNTPPNTGVYKDISEELFYQSPITVNNTTNFPGLGIWNTSGNVGIGTQNPAFKLDVIGTIRAKEVLVNLDGGADFVFEKDYKLLPIEHVANYVQENKHLPDIPSANEMVKNGVSMGDMQVKLLQKVEELTLYVIELKKEINQLKQRDK